VRDVWKQTASRLRHKVAADVANSLQHFGLDPREFGLQVSFGTRCPDRDCAFSHFPYRQSVHVRISDDKRKVFVSWRCAACLRDRAKYEFDVATILAPTPSVR